MLTQKNRNLNNYVGNRENCSQIILSIKILGLNVLQVNCFKRQKKMKSNLSGYKLRISMTSKVVKNLSLRAISLNRDVKNFF